MALGFHVPEWRALQSELLRLGTECSASVAYGVVVTVAGLTLGHVPLVGSFLVGVISNLLLLAQALLVGRFLRHHGTEFGYG